MAENVIWSTFALYFLSFWLRTPGQDGRRVRAAVDLGGAGSRTPDFGQFVVLPCTVCHVCNVL